MRKRPFVNPYLSAIERIFTPSVIVELATSGTSKLLNRLVTRYSLFTKEDENLTVAELIDQAYTILTSEQYRHEYIYKNTIVRNILLGKYSLNTATMLSEFRVGSCKLDLGVLNSESVAYEIKTEFDNLNRLESQVLEYSKMFNLVNVVTDSSRISEVMDHIPGNVGVITLNERYNLTLIRKAKRSPRSLDASTIFNSMRMVEIRKLMRMNEMNVPDVPNTIERKACMEKLLRLPISKISQSACEVLKTARNKSYMANLLKNAPASISSLLLARELNEKNIANITYALKSQFKHSPVEGI